MAEQDGSEAEYQRVADGLRRMIVERGLQPGDEMPSLQEVMDQYSVGIMVARRAQTELRIEGIIKTRQGKKALVHDPAAAKQRSSDLADRLATMEAVVHRIDDKLTDDITPEVADIREQLSVLQDQIQYLYGLAGVPYPQQAGPPQKVAGKRIRSA